MAGIRSLPQLCPGQSGHRAQPLHARPDPGDHAAKNALLETRGRLRRARPIAGAVARRQSKPGRGAARERR
jgi:hypothetical protein